MEYLDAFLVSLVLIFIIASLYLEWVGPGLTFGISVIMLGVLGILTPVEILAGFANEQIAVIVLLLMIGDVTRKSGILDNFFEKIFLSAKTYRSFLSRLILTVAGFSAFLNNTPLVAIMMPFTYSWGKQHNFTPSKLLIPLSYAAILGGCATLIGTSTNLIVNGLVIDQKIIPDLQPLNIFDFSIVGVPMILVGFIYLMVFSNKLLPEKKDIFEDLSNKSREYMVEVIVRKGSNIAGLSIEEAGLRNLKGLFLVEIVRKTLVIKAVSPNTILYEQDVLIFAGDTETITEMINAKSGLQLSQVGMFSKKSQTEVMEIVVSHNSTLIGKTVKQANFRGKYDAAIIAVHRNGERISGKIGMVKLRAGDVLLILAGNDFLKRAAEVQDFYLMSRGRKFRKIPAYKSIILLGGVILAVILSAFHLVPLFISLTLLLVLVMLLRITSPKDIHKSIDFNLIFVIALSLALGTAMIKSGLASIVARNGIDIFKPLGIIGILTGIYLVTAILASYITNKAAVALIFPISLAMAVDLNAPVLPFILVVAFAGAASFMTPIGYQTNLMVYGPGGYSFRDYFKIGFPLTLIYMVVTISILWIYYF